MASAVTVESLEISMSKIHAKRFSFQFSSDHQFFILENEFYITVLGVFLRLFSVKELEGGCVRVEETKTIFRLLKFIRRLAARFSIVFRHVQLRS